MLKVQNYHNMMSVCIHLHNCAMSIGSSDLIAWSDEPHFVLLDMNGPIKIP